MSITLWRCNCNWNLYFKVIVIVIEVILCNWTQPWLNHDWVEVDSLSVSLGPFSLTANLHTQLLTLRLVFVVDTLFGHVSTRAGSNYTKSLQLQLLWNINFNYNYNYTSIMLYSITITPCSFQLQLQINFSLVNYTFIYGIFC